MEKYQTLENGKGVLKPLVDTLTFPFGRAGVVNSFTWLRKAGNSPSNRSGYAVNLNNLKVTQVACSTRNTESYSVSVYEHNGNLSSLTLLGTVSVVSDTEDVFNVNYTATAGKQLAVRINSITTGIVRDIEVVLTVKGNAP